MRERRAVQRNWAGEVKTFILRNKLTPYIGVVCLILLSVWWWGFIMGV